MSELDTLQTQLLEQVESAATLADLDAVRVSVLGKKGVITEKMKSLGAMNPDERKAAGQQFNAIIIALADAIESKTAKLEEDEINARLAEIRAMMESPDYDHAQSENLLAEGRSLNEERAQIEAEREETRQMLAELRKMQAQMQHSDQ